MIFFKENNKDDDDDDDDTEKPTDEWAQKIIYSLRCDDLLTHAPVVKVH
jgi:hypothetical protein